MAGLPIESRSMDKRYQVFVSSTYADLKDERQSVIQALMEMDCIPAGMELFPATDEEQWQFIKRVIDDCDYYLLIIGGRYGSTTSEGISYTEKEYEYAVERGIKVIALLHDKPDEIPAGKTELSPGLRKKLDAFRDQVSQGRLVRFWNRASDLPGIVALSLQKTIKMFPAIGWVRANTISNETALSELNELRKENAALNKRLGESVINPPLEIERLANLDEGFTAHMTESHRGTITKWTIRLSWRDIFSDIAPYLLKVPTEKRVQELVQLSFRNRGERKGQYQYLVDQDFQTITIQLKALGLINTELEQGSLFWSLTPKGERLMMELRTVRSKKSKSSKLPAA
ncbi:MAG: hypothetical protein JWN40_3390 [Phycisphaerales bacterium]|nr:hypothetical protein [Phycisphaerales bacterium]